MEVMIVVVMPFCISLLTALIYAQSFSPFYIEIEYTLSDSKKTLLRISRSRSRELSCRLW